MLKLKVGKNYLYTHKELSKLTLHKGLSFMMSNFEGENKVCFILERKIKQQVLNELIKSVRQDRVSTLYVLTFCLTEDVGKDKNLWVRDLKNRIKDFADSLKISCDVVNTLSEAVDVAYKSSNAGDTILLSPACASWDQYKCFEDRGMEFKECVKRYKES